MSSEDPRQSTAASGGARADRPGGLRRAAHIVLRAVLPLSVVAGGAALAAHLLQTGPKAKRRARPRRARLVDVQPVRLTRQRVIVYAMGTVRSAREIDLHPRVTGEIVHVSEEFVPGGRFSSGQTLVRLDARDYELAVQQRACEVVQMQSDLALERGQQAVAKREFEMLGQTITDADRALMLRVPQLEMVEAKVDGALSAFQKALLDLERTTVVAPFNAVVQTRDVDLGAQVAPTTRLATLVGTDEFWIEAAVPVDRLKWIRIPREAGEVGSPVRVRDESAWGPDAHRTGHVLRLEPSLEEQGRMARLLVAVKDPLALTQANAGRPALLLGSYVRLEIEGSELADVAAIDRSLLRDGDTVWIMDADDRLEMRPVTVSHRAREQVFVTAGLRAGERLVVTDIGGAVKGMDLRTEPRAGAGSQPSSRPAESAPRSATTEARP